MYTRISGRVGNSIGLDVTFNRGGVPTDPYAITKVSIYKTQILPSNKVAEFILNDPCDPSYPDPVVALTEDVPAGDCGTDPQIGSIIPGKYRLEWDIPSDATAPCVYYDVWNYFPVNPCTLSDFQDLTICGSDTDCPDLTATEFSDAILQSCHRFWVYPDNWTVDDGLQTIRFGFEPLDQRFKKPEHRPLEIGLMPLPLYDYNFNLVTPLLPLLTATITIETMNREVLVENASMSIGIRQGSYRTNPFVLRHLIDTSAFLIGTYKYRVTLHMPDGTSRCSEDFILTIS